MQLFSTVLAQGVPLTAPVDASDVLKGCPTTHIKTAIGCIPFSDTVTIAKTAATISIAVSGGIVLILIGMASIRIMTSSGDPKSLAAARESLFSAIGGLLMIIFAGFVLRLIGVDILGVF